MGLPLYISESNQNYVIFNINLFSLTAPRLGLGLCLYLYAVFFAATDSFGE